MKERNQKSNLDTGNLSDSHDNSINITHDDETNQFLEGSDQSPFPSNSSYEVPSPLPSTSSYANPSPASTISLSLGSNSHNKKNNKTSQQPTTAQVLQNYIDSKKAKVEPPSDHIGAFFTAMEATTRRLPPVLQIEAKAKISALLSDLEMKAYYLSTEHNVSIASPHQSTVELRLTVTVGTGAMTVNRIDGSVSSDSHGIISGHSLFHPFFNLSNSFNDTANMTLTAHNIASPLQRTSYQTNNMTPTVSPSKPMDFSTCQHRTHCTTYTSTSGGQIEIFGIDNNLYTFQ
ncbi:uncharacterized protein LOC132926114 [Rhopalosiphum padi]|uniref:uncharacterized protein LOC132926114 n=1 Tax=Rhopalosiphum padi TaxID=40932 RepID=UPI00298D709E|nr:uncharacterized protein LOC132926114 [Rhopalosiphum padi]